MPIITLIIGAFLGVLTGSFANWLQRKSNVSLKLVDRYLDVRKELADAISPLTNVPLDREIGAIELAEKRDLVVSLFYRHFDFLPGPVLTAMICLEVCLDRPDEGLFEIRDRVLMKMDPSRVQGFVNECCLLENARFYIPFVLNGSNPVARKNQCIRLHARSVLMALNQYASDDDIMKMIGDLKKGLFIRGNK